MKNLKNRILLGFNLGVFIPTPIYFLSLVYYGFMSMEELIISFTTPRVWMLFVIIYFPLLNLYIGRKLNIVANYMANPAENRLTDAQKIVARLPFIFIFNVMVYATTGASSLLLFEDFFTRGERVLALLLGFAFVFVYALPFFIRTVMQIEKWTTRIPPSKRYSFLSVKGKLYFSLFCNVLGVAIVIVILNLGVVMSNFGTNDFSGLLQTLLLKNLVIGFACLMIVTINLRMLTIQLVSPLEEITHMFKIISNGDLTVKIDIASKDEIGTLKLWIDHFVEKIHDVIATVRLGAAQVDVSSHKLIENIGTITSSMSDMSSAANQIAGSAEDTCKTIGDVIKSLNELDFSITNIANHSVQASTQGMKTVEVTKHGKEFVSYTIKEMDIIHEEMAKLAGTIEKMGYSVAQIERIINMINDITRQTNMLAINASIEAARAGEKGRGFGVVADSIGKLSEESKLSTKEITKLVKEIQQTVNFAIETTRESVQKVEKGVELVRKTNHAFDEIYAAINSTTDLVQEIATATEKQAGGSKIIMSAINKVNDMSLQVSALVQEQVAATEEVATTLEVLNSSSSDSTSQILAQESRELYKLISTFRVKE